MKMFLVNQHLVACGEINHNLVCKGKKVFVKGVPGGTAKVGGDIWGVKGYRDAEGFKIKIWLIKRDQLKRVD